MRGGASEMRDLHVPFGVGTLYSAHVCQYFPAVGPGKCGWTDDPIVADGLIFLLRSNHRRVLGGAGQT